VDRPIYRVELSGLVRELPLFEVAPGLRVAVFNMLGDVEITRVAARELSSRLRPLNPELIVTAEAKSIPLAYEIAGRMELPYVVLRKTYKPYMGNALQAETLSITTGSPQTLYLDEKDQALLGGKRVAIVDDVVTTGSTLEGMRRLMAMVDAEVVGEAAVFTEGEHEWRHVIALGHLPLFADESG
jgi:adenine/guanine phosphoribosyltransferase-like PRPP-binding protein